MSEKYNDAYWQEMIDEIMDEFDFQKVHRCMEELDWHWTDCGGVPDKPTLRRRARQMLRNCVDQGHGGSGGFEVKIDRTEGALSLSFVIESWDAYKEKEETN